MVVMEKQNLSVKLVVTLSIQSLIHVMLMFVVHIYWYL